MDLQQRFALPILNVAKQMYCRKVWIHNLEVHLFQFDKGHMYICTEDVTRLGTDEIISSLKPSSTERV